MSEPHDIVAAKRFLQQAIKKRGIHQKITLDGYGASHVAVGELYEEGSLPTKLVKGARIALSTTSLNRTTVA